MPSIILSSNNFMRLLQTLTHLRLSTPISKVDDLNAEMGQMRIIMKYIQEDIEQNRIIASNALAFGVVGAAESVASIGMQINNVGIGFSTIKEKVGVFLQRMISKSYMYSRATEVGRYDLLSYLPLSLEEYKSLIDETLDDN